MSAWHGICIICAGSAIKHPPVNLAYHFKTTSLMKSHPDGPSVVPWPMSYTATRKLYQLWKGTSLNTVVNT
eukprot:15341775-Ditylum_brightwellii.AAC.1